MYRRNTPTRTLKEKEKESKVGRYPTYTSKDVDFNVDQVIVTCFTLTVMLQFAWNSTWPKRARRIRPTRFASIVNHLLVRAVSGSYISVHITETKVFTQRTHISQSVCNSTSVCISVGLLETRSQSSANFKCTVRSRGVILRGAVADPKNAIFLRNAFL